MTIIDMMLERLIYYQIALNDAGIITTVRGLALEPTITISCAAEMAYYYEHDRLPDWAIVIERVEDTGNGLIFIHAAQH